MWTVWIRDQAACSLQSDLDVHCPQKLLVSLSVRKELKGGNMKTLWEKEKILGTSIFSFFYNIFSSSWKENKLDFLIHFYFVICKCF